MENKKVIKIKKTCNNLCCTKIENFSVKIGNNQILKDVNLHIHCGELTTLIGPNGAGKSTLVKSLLGEVSHSGTLKYLGEDSEEYEKPIIGYVPQYLTFDVSTPTSVLDIFVAANTKRPAWIGASKKFKAKVIENLKKVKADYLVDRKLGALSGGEMQRVLLALALDPIPNILILDEPVSGIDQNGLELFYDLLSEIKSKYDLSIILVSHDLDLVAKYSDRVVLINKTVLCSGTPKEVFNDPKTSKIFGMTSIGKGEWKNA